MKLPLTLICRPDGILYWTVDGETTPGARRENADSSLCPYTPAELAHRLVNEAGTRPAGWWRFDSPRDDERPDMESDPAFLLRHGLLTKGGRERVPVAAFERTEFPDPYRFERPDPRKALSMVR